MTRTGGRRSERWMTVALTPHHEITAAGCAPGAPGGRRARAAGGGGGSSVFDLSRYLCDQIAHEVGIELALGRSQPAVLRLIIGVVEQQVRERDTVRRVLPVQPSLGCAGAESASTAMAFGAL